MSDMGILIERHLELLEMVDEGTKTLKRLGKEIQKAKDDIDELEILCIRLEEIYKNMKAAPVLALSEYARLIELIPINQKALIAKRNFIKKAKKDIEEVEQDLAGHRRDVAIVEGKMGAWGTLLPFKKRNDNK